MDFQAEQIRAFLSSTFAQVIIWTTVLSMLIAAGVYVLRRFRGSAEQEQQEASNLLTNFRELHSQGELSDQEYRTIKTLLAARLQDEIKDTGKPG